MVIRWDGERKHQKFVRVEHQDECDLITDNVKNRKPTHFNKFFEESAHINASLEELKKWTPSSNP